MTKTAYIRDGAPCDPAQPMLPPDPCAFGWRRTRDHVTLRQTGNAPLMEEITPAPTPPIPKFRFIGQEAQSIQGSWVPVVTIPISQGYVGIQATVKTALSDPVIGDQVEMALMAGTRIIGDPFRPGQTFESSLPLLGYKAPPGTKLIVAARIEASGWNLPVAVPAEGIATRPIISQVAARAELEVFMVAEAAVKEYEDCLKAQGVAR